MLCGVALRFVSVDRLAHRAKPHIIDGVLSGMLDDDRRWLAWFDSDFLIMNAAIPLEAIIGFVSSSVAIVFARVREKKTRMSTHC